MTPPTPRRARGLRRSAALLALAAAALGGACAEQLDSGAACPALCPLENEPVRDTVLFPVAFDTTLAGFPLPGDLASLQLAIAPGPDTVDVRIVVRFDSLPARFAPPAGGDSVAITTVDSSYLRLRLDTANTRYSADVQVDAYDVDTPVADDTTAASLLPLFRPDRLLGTATLVAGTPVDSLRVRLADAVVAERARAGRRLRIGLRLRSAAAARVRVGSAAAGTGTQAPTLRFDPASDTTYSPILVNTSSSAPAIPVLARRLEDYALVAATSRAADGQDLVVGGVPGRRSLLRFDVPRRLTDSTSIVRATLELIQRPGFSVVRTDTAERVVVFPEPVLASESVTDLRRIMDLSGGASDTLALRPLGSGVQRVPLVNLVRAWRGLPATTQRGLVLRAGFEGTQASEVRFYSTDADPALRPRLRLSYVPRTSFGLP